MTFTRENEQNQTHFMSFIQRCVNFHTCLHPHQLFLNRLHIQSARSLVYTSREFILYCGGTIQHWNMCWNILGRIQQQQQEQAGIFSTLSTSVLVCPSRRLKKPRLILNSEIKLLLAWLLTPPLSLCSYPATVESEWRAVNWKNTSLTGEAQAPGRVCTDDSGTWTTSFSNSSAEKVISLDDYIRQGLTFYWRIE